MKKEDLKYGNVVELRNGYKLFYHQFCEGDLLDFDGNGCIMLDNFDENLKHLYSLDFDIVKVYEDFTLTKLLCDRKKIFILTGDEFRKLEALKKLDFNYIVRDANDSLWAYVNEPNKKDSGWFSFGNVYKLDDNLFQFIRWEDEIPYLINEILGVA